jgi:FAD/FMN-containing dehydrogenase
MNDMKQVVLDDAAGPRAAYHPRCDAISRALAGNTEQVYLTKRSTSNLFRYGRRRRQGTRAVGLKDFNHVLSIDIQNQILEAEGLTTYETIVAHCIEHDLLPTVTPELKHITLGGAIVGIGIESTCHSRGFVHDGLIEADVLLPGGDVISCRADNEQADLFRALPNSYGTLGYILRAKVRLMPVKRYVQLTNLRFTDIDVYLVAMEEAVRRAKHTYIDGLFYSDRELYLTLGDGVDEAPWVDDIYGTSIFYRTLRSRDVMYLKSEDYIFRYDPDWFWNIPETGPYRLFRRFAPKRLRSSGFYNRYVAHKHRLTQFFHIPSDRSVEQLIQDWEVPWDRAPGFVRYLLDNIDIQRQPWVALPVRTPVSPTLYPIRAEQLYLNIGCYCFARRPRVDEDYYYTRLLDGKCFALGGLKMLYSSTFLEKPAFDHIYNGEVYRALKQKYDPNGCAPTLYEKAVKAK